MDEFIRIIKWLAGIVISVILTDLINRIPIKQIFSNTSWNWVIISRFSILNAIIFVTLLIITLLIIAQISKKIQSTQLDTIEKELKKVNTMTIKENDVKVTWNVYMGNDNDPYISNIKLFCLKHGDIPLIMQNNACTIDSCINSKRSCDKQAIRNHIESKLYDMRDQIKAKGN